jgi:hypothetical protein
MTHQQKGTQTIAELAQVVDDSKERVKKFLV